MTGTPSTLGPYRIVSLLGEGGMGEVWLAEDTRLERRVAIKLLPESVSQVPEAKKRMLREARAVAALDHPNVCAVYEVGEHEGRPYIVMQYIEGETLFARLQRARPTLAEALDIGVQLASALDEAHRRGIVHRDVKTLNAMITPRGQLKVLDFGLAKLTGSADLSTTLESLATQPGTITGTAPYMSPEQLRGLPLDGRSDIFSLGVVLYEMAAGRRPFDRENTVSTITAVLFEEPPPLTGPQWKPLAPVVRRALAKDPARRYPDAGALLEALRRLQQRPARGRARRPREAVAPAPAEPLPTEPVLTPTEPITAPAPARARLDSLAVVPVSRAVAPEHEYLVHGLAESTVGALSQMRRVRVTAATGPGRPEGEFEPLRLGRELGVAGLVLLRAQVSGEQLYVDAALVNTADGAQLWASQYMRPQREVAALAEAIAADVAEQVKARSGGSSGARRAARKKRTVDPEAQQLFLKGRYQWIKRVPEALKAAMAFFQQAVEHDPFFALPYAGLADAFVMLGFMQALPAREVLPRAKAAAQRAIELDPTLADPHATLGYAAGLFEWDWEAAQHELAEAMRLNPNYPWAPHWLGLLASGRGETEEGLRLIERAQKLDPLSPIVNIAAGIPLHIARRYEEAVARYRHVLETESTFAPGHYYLGMSLEQLGRHEEAIGHMERLLEIAGPTALYMGSLAHTCARAGRVAQAERLLAQMLELARERYLAPHSLALAYAGLDRRDEALQAVEQALEQRNAWMWFFRVEPRFDRLREDPRCEPLLQRHGLPPLARPPA